MHSLWTVLVPLIATLQEGPDPEDVKAGWLGFGVFLLLAVAVALLGFSLRKHLRKVDFEEQGDAPAERSDKTQNGDHPSSV
jgi:hypothetical protein